ncbi:MerR family DNA-binding transcriptional regulator [Actinoplanes bogorensis]|uniref:MerR family DNA-binding transcriptional regulator n=1 Tax=Paractinoplanes bogorensis TaxID=1610840 RepID=A0ABS5Z5H1_9ACTN|nr:MerR family transcriptional regulator [Actinoplanes bogorensis]MBU2670189.1 MerR family DNA-binding transcriptional regulator [Actinoplanes bogorensis]
MPIDSAHKSGWSTQELADLAGTTVKTVRHYHSIGLLTEPERAANGYKRYATTHLVRLLRIRRLVDLGLPLSEIAGLEASDTGLEQTFRALDARFEESIARQQRIRAELAAILGRSTLVDLPPGFDRTVGERSEAIRMFLLLSDRLLDPPMVETFRTMMEHPDSATAVDFDALTEDASDETRQDLAERCVTEIVLNRPSHAHLRELADRATTGPDRANWQIIIQALMELNTPVQNDVLRRMHTLLRSHGIMRPEPRSGCLGEPRKSAPSRHGQGQLPG